MVLTVRLVLFIFVIPPPLCLSVLYTGVVLMGTTTTSSYMVVWWYGGAVNSDHLASS